MHKTSTNFKIWPPESLFWSVEQKKIMDHFDNFLIQIPVKSGHHAAPFHQLVLADYSLNHWNNRTSKIGYLLLQEKSDFFFKRRFMAVIFSPKKKIHCFWGGIHLFFSKEDNLIFLHKRRYLNGYCAIKWLLHPISWKWPHTQTEDHLILNSHLEYSGQRCTYYLQISFFHLL